MNQNNLCIYCAEDKATKPLTSKNNPKSYIYVHDNNKCFEGLKKLIPGLIEVKNG